MPTIVIKNGTRTLKLTKREQDTLHNAKAICDDIAAKGYEGFVMGRRAVTVNDFSAGATIASPGV